MLAPRDDATPCSVEEATGVEDILIANDKAPEEFEPVPFKVVDRAWAVTGRHQWRRPLTLPVAEARASLNAVKHVIRTQANWGMKHLLLSDSMTAVCALSRGRAQGFELRRVCQPVRSHSFGDTLQLLTAVDTIRVEPCGRPIARVLDGVATQADRPAKTGAGNSSFLEPRSWGSPERIWRDRAW